MKKFSKFIILGAFIVMVISTLAFSANAATYTISNASQFKTYLYDSSLWSGGHTFKLLPTASYLRVRKHQSVITARLLKAL